MNVVSQTQIDWFSYGKGMLSHYPSNQKLNLEEYNHKNWSQQEEIYDKRFGSWLHLRNIIWNMKTEWESELNDVILAPPFGKAN